MDNKSIQNINAFSTADSQRITTANKENLTDDTKKIASFGAQQNSGNSKVDKTPNATADDLFMATPNRRTRINSRLQSSVMGQQQELQEMKREVRTAVVSELDIEDALGSFIQDSTGNRVQKSAKVEPGSDKPIAQQMTKTVQHKASKPEQDTTSPVSEDEAEHTTQQSDKRTKTAEPVVKKHKPLISDNEDEEDLVDEAYAKAVDVLQKAGTSARKAGLSIREKTITFMQLASADRMFKDSSVIKTNVMTFRNSGNSIMAYKYTGSNTVIRIPAYVNGLPVEYLHTKFLKRVAVVSNTAKAVQNFMDGTMVDHKTSDYQFNPGKITRVILPETLKVIPAELFYGCHSLHELVIPASVSVMPNDAILNSGINVLIFNGACPNGFLLGALPANVTVYVKTNFANTFRR